MARDFDDFDDFDDGFSRRRRQKRGPPALITFIVAIAALGLLVVGVAVAGSLTPEADRDPVTLCPTGAEAKHSRIIVFLVDQSDPLDDQQINDILDEANDQFSKLRLDEMFAIYAVNAELYARPKQITAFCNPVEQPMTIWDRAKEQIVGNQRKRQAEFEKLKQKFEKDISVLKTGKPTATTALMSDLTTISNYRVFQKYEKQNLVIVSDMIENSPLLNQYLTQSPKTFAEFKSAIGLRYQLPRLDNTSVRILYQNNIKTAAVQTAAHQEFWRDFFFASGVDADAVEFDHEIH